MVFYLFVASRIGETREWGVAKGFSICLLRSVGPSTLKEVLRPLFSSRSHPQEVLGPSGKWQVVGPPPHLTSSRFLVRLDLCGRWGSTPAPPPPPGSWPPSPSPPASSARPAAAPSRRGSDRRAIRRSGDAWGGRPTLRRGMQKEAPGPGANEGNIGKPNVQSTRGTKRGLEQESFQHRMG